MLDSAEVPDKVVKTQAERDEEANLVFTTVLHEVNNISKQRKGLEAKRIYLGQSQFDKLRGWSGIRQYVHHAVEGDHLLGLPFYVVKLEDHLYVAWE